MRRGYSIAARRILWLVTGSSKTEMHRRAARGGSLDPGRTRSQLLGIVALADRTVTAGACPRPAARANGFNATPRPDSWGRAAGR